MCKCLPLGRQKGYMRPSLMQKPRNTGCEHMESSCKRRLEKGTQSKRQPEKREPLSLRSMRWASHGLPSPAPTYSPKHVSTSKLTLCSLAPFFRTEFTPCIPKDSSKTLSLPSLIAINWQLGSFCLLVSHVHLIPTTRIKTVWRQKLDSIFSLTLHSTRPRPELNKASPTQYVSRDWHSVLPRPQGQYMPQPPYSSLLWTSHDVFSRNWFIWMHRYTSLHRKDWSTLQFLHPLPHRLLIPQLPWKHSPKSHRDQCSQTQCYIKHTLLDTSWGFSCSDPLTLCKYFFPPLCLSFKCL